MFRNLMFATATGLGLLVPAALPEKAEAGTDIRVEFRSGPRYYGAYAPVPVVDYYRPSYPVYDYHYQHFRVLYRTCPHEPWCVYGVYHSHGAAHRVADRLVWRGYETRVLHR